MASGHSPVEHQADVVEVNRCRQVTLAPRLFGRHEVRSPHNTAITGGFAVV